MKIFLSVWTISLLLEGASAGACQKCSDTGATIGGTPNCCPVGQTCDQPNGGNCIAAEPADEDTGNYYDCKRTKIGGCKIWCPYGLTCTAPDDSGLCKPVKKDTTDSTPANSSSSSSSSQEPTSSMSPSASTSSSQGSSSSTPTSSSTPSPTYVP